MLLRRSLDLLATADLSGHIHTRQLRLGARARALHGDALLATVHRVRSPGGPCENNAESAALSTARARRSSSATARAPSTGITGGCNGAAASPAEGVIHAVAHDVTEEHEAERRLADDATRLEAKVTERRGSWTKLAPRRCSAWRSRPSTATTRPPSTRGASARRRRDRRPPGVRCRQVAILREAAPLHDVGKLAIPDRSCSRGDAEQPGVRGHEDPAKLGERLLSGSHSPVLEMAAVIAASHHERWDGGVIPGPRGEAIPLVGRIVAVAECSMR